MLIPLKTILEKYKISPKGILHIGANTGFSMKKICGIYKITSPSGRIYIGQGNDVYKRWIDYRRLDCKRQLKLKKDMAHIIKN